MENQLEIEVAQILWELFFDRSTVLGHLPEMKVLKSVGTMNMRAVFRNKDIISAVLEGWKLVKAFGLEEVFLPYDYCYCDFFLGQCMSNFQTLHPNWKAILDKECVRLKNITRGVVYVDCSFLERPVAFCLDNKGRSFGASRNTYL